MCRGAGKRGYVVGAQGSQEPWAGFLYWLKGRLSSKYGWKTCWGQKRVCAGRQGKDRDGALLVSLLELLLLCREGTWANKPREHTEWMPSAMKTHWHCLLVLPTVWHTLFRRVILFQMQLVVNAIVHLKTTVILIDSKSLHTIVKTAMSGTKTLQNL